MRALMTVFPLFVIPVAIYGLIALSMPGEPALMTHGGLVLSEKASPLIAVLGQKFLSIEMMGGDVEWILTRGDILLLVSTIALFAEMIKSTSVGTATILNHALSMILFIVCLILFLLHSSFATSVFFIITVMAFLDVLAGIIVTIISARRDFAINDNITGP